MEFSAVVEDEIVEPKRDIWANVAHPTASRLVAYTDSLRKTVDAVWSPPGGSAPIFVESSDKWLYGVFRGASLKFTKVKRFRVDRAGRRVTNVEDLVDFPTQTVLSRVPGTGSRNSAFVDPSGRAYFEVRTDPADVVHEPEARRYLRLRQDSGGAWLLEEVGVVEEAVPTHSSFVASPSLFGHYDVVTVTTPVRRSFVLVILKDSRWMAADPIVHPPLQSELLDGDVTGQCMIGNNSFPCSGGVFQTTTVRVWGNAWWEKSSATAPWTAPAGSALTTGTRGFALNIQGLQGTLEQEGAAPSASKSLRVTHTSSTRLPTLLLDRNYGLGQGVEADCPFQAVGTLEADGSALYVMMKGDREDTLGGGQVFVPGAIHKAGVPAVGGLPVWTSLIPEPNLDSTNKQWDNYVVPTARWLWIPESDFSSPNKKRLLAYSKSGGTPAVVREDVGLGAGVGHITAGWRARWK